MLLEAYIWGWIHLHPVHVLKKLATLMALAVLVLLPLLYINAGLARMGFMPTSSSFEIQVAKPMPGEN